MWYLTSHSGTGADTGWQGEEWSDEIKGIQEHAVEHPLVCIGFWLRVRRCNTDIRRDKDHRTGNGLRTSCREGATDLRAVEKLAE